MLSYFWSVNGSAETDATGRPTSSGTGTASSAPKLVLIPQPLTAVFILQLTKQQLDVCSQIFGVLMDLLGQMPQGGLPVQGTGATFT